MSEFNRLYEFIDLAQKNRKYPQNTAHGRRAALKLFETVLHPDELESLGLIEERMKEIFLSLISKHRDTFSIKSLQTYKGRLLNLLQDYKRYGANPEAFTQWEIKIRKTKNKDTTLDTIKDTPLSTLSSSIHRAVYKIQISLENGSSCTMELPPTITKEDASIITKIIDSLAER